MPHRNMPAQGRIITDCSLQISDVVNALIRSFFGSQFSQFVETRSKKILHTNYTAKLLTDML